MKLCIAGSRTIKPNYLEIQHVLMMYNFNFTTFSEIVSGTAKGADKAGEAFAEYFNIDKKLFPADWVTYGKSAGPIRNKVMAEYCDMAMIWWDGQSKGTKNMIERLQNFNKPYILCLLKDGKFDTSFIKSSTL